MKLVFTLTVVCPLFFFCYAALAVDTSNSTMESSIFQRLAESLVNETMQFVANSLSSVISNVFQFVDDEDQCPLGCAANVTLPQEMNDYLESLHDDWLQFRNQTSAEGLNMRRVFDVAQLRIECRLFHELSACIRNCQERPWKKRLSEWLKPAIYLCDESNFIQYTDCYRAVYEEDKDHCDEKCEDKKQHLLTAFRPQVITSTTTPSLSDYDRLIADGVKLACNYVLCKTKCRSNEIISKCGQEAESTLRTTYKYVIASVKSINKFTFDSFDEESSQKLIYADQCESI